MAGLQRKAPGGSKQALGFTCSGWELQGPYTVVRACGGSPVTHGYCELQSLPVEDVRPPPKHWLGAPGPLGHMWQKGALGSTCGGW